MIMRPRADEAGPLNSQVALLVLAVIGGTATLILSAFLFWGYRKYKRSLSDLESQLQSSRVATDYWAQQCRYLEDQNPRGEQSIPLDYRSPTVFSRAPETPAVVVVEQDAGSVPWQEYIDDTFVVGSDDNDSDVESVYNMYPSPPSSTLAQASPQVRPQAPAPPPRRTTMPRMPRFEDSSSESDGERQERELGELEQWSAAIYAGAVDQGRRIDADNEARARNARLQRERAAALRAEEALRAEAEASNHFDEANDSNTEVPNGVSNEVSANELSPIPA
ncbi:hypothetical protein B0T16DRAFT_492061 [Cercophora newfieldiana]|uniref:Uncharacterized protein n=1 Tax=Cercophora newfieldiana TaxID=92897 RepID=A0AA39YEB2_9PEZI|nr:hypothetical protein B0T16DRAFT_492061 [Cercophora newfieldiana]